MLEQNQNQGTDINKIMLVNDHLIIVSTNNLDKILYDFCKSNNNSVTEFWAASINVKL